LKEIVAAPEVIEAVEVKGEEQAQVEIEAVVADNVSPNNSSALLLFPRGDALIMVGLTRYFRQAAGDDVTELIKEAEAAVAAV
jgi:hypothetical protein